MDPRRSTTASTVLATTLIVSFGAAVWLGRFYLPAAHMPELRIAPADVAPPATNSPIDWTTWRRKAWDKIEPRIDEADREALECLKVELASIDEFFYERRAGTKPFAEAVLSLQGKWVFVKSKLPTVDDDAHLKFLQEKFEQNIFAIADLKTVIESAIGGYVSRVQGIENQLLVDVRADLSEREFAVPGAPLAALPEQEFRRRFERLLQDVAEAVARDSQFAVSREVVSFVSGEIAAQIAVRVATAVATRLGVSAGILGTGAASSWATFGIGLVAAVAIDVAIDRITKIAGYDPAEKISEKVRDVLKQVRTLLVEGDPEALAALDKLRSMARSDNDATVRAESQKAVDSIEAGGSLGLRRELLKLHETRAKLRREALRRLVFDETGEAL
ncbi:MAG: hypothetical protein K8U03_00990 [Planctomycetia bacterium]|nr:hypothetical protein [Planctomycetia bacterium]